MSVYGGIGGAQAVFAVLVSITLALGSLIASRTYHSALLKKIFYAPMSFFDTNPLGNVLNRNLGFRSHQRSIEVINLIENNLDEKYAWTFIRIGNDIFNIDSTIPNAMGLLINLLFMTIANIIVIIYAIWQFILVFVPVSVIYVVVQRFYVACSRQLRRIESKLKAPIYSNFQETIQE